MYSLEVIKHMNSPEQTQKRRQSNSGKELVNYQLKKFGEIDNPKVNTELEELKVELKTLKIELGNTKKELNSIKQEFNESLISRLDKIENSNNTLPLGTKVKICDTDTDISKVEGKVEHETKKFYVINGKRYHKYGLKFFDVTENNTIVLEDTKW